MLSQVDRDNLKFIVALAAKKDGSFQEWLDTLTPDDTSYALSLLQAYNESRERFLNLL